MFLFSLSFVSAEDVNKENVLLIQDVSDVSQDEILNNGLKGTFTDLQEKINTAQNESIDLDSDYVYTGGKGGKGISITKNITINGNGHTIDANSNSRIFCIDNNLTKVILNNITFININEFDGVETSAIYSTGDLTVMGCRFEDNTNLTRCGIIESHGNLNIICSSFTGYAFYDGSNAVSSKGNLTVIDSNFSDNSYTNMGGAIFSDGSALVKSSVFDNNFAEAGGAIFSTGSLIVQDSNFNANCAHYFGGGAIYASGDLTVEGCNFIGNDAPDWDHMGNTGGAIYALSSLNVINSTFVNNMAGTYDSREGNAIYAYRAYANINNSTFINNSIALTKFSSQFNLLFNSSAVPAGESILICAEFDNKNISGNVTIRINDDEKKMNIVNGSVNLVLDHLACGTYDVEVFYPENDYWWGYYEKARFNVFGSYIIDAPYLIKYYGGDERFEVNVRDLDNKEISGKDVIIAVNGEEYVRTTDEGGYASIAVNLNSGRYDVTVRYNDSIVNSKITVKSTISGENVTKMFRNATQYYATFVDSEGSPLCNASVEFNINGVFYTRYTDENGTAGLNINLNPGVYIITAKNSENNDMFSNIITVLPTIVENNDLVKYYKNDSYYSLRLLGNDGNPLGAGVKVSLNINGVFYERYTNESGYVRLNINLEPGDYIVTADFNGCMVSNNIKVLPVLKASDLVMSYRDGSTFNVSLIDGHGNLLAYTNVIFNINGVFYERTTDDEGIASLNINLMKGEYIITSSYNGSNIANKITIV